LVMSQILITKKCQVGSVTYKTAHSGEINVVIANPSQRGEAISEAIPGFDLPVPSLKGVSQFNSLRLGISKGSTDRMECRPKED
jgi:hypothetical protein